MSYIAILKVNAGTNRVEKYQPCATQEEAEAHVQNYIGTYPLAYSAVDVGGSSEHWSCDTSAKTIVIDTLVDPEAFNKLRKLAYPEIGDQLDMLYHDQVDGTTTFKDTIEAVKDAVPKP